MRRKRKVNVQNISDFRNNFKRPTICIICVQKRREPLGDRKKIFEKRIAEKFPTFKELYNLCLTNPKHEKHKEQ